MDKEKEKPEPFYGDYGDDIKDFEKKEKEAWNYELQNNPMYQYLGLR